MAACQIPSPASSSDDSSSEAEEYDLGASCYDSNEFANFALDSNEMEKCLRTLHFSTSKAKMQTDKYRLTSTSLWSRKTSRACAAFKILKTKRWLLTDVNHLFDPLDRNETKCERGAVLWPTDSQPLESKMIKSMSLDGVLTQAYSHCHAVYDNLRLIDEIMKDIDGPLTSHQHYKSLSWMYDQGLQLLPDRLHAPFLRFYHAFLNAMSAVLNEGKASELVFQHAFQQMFNCVASCCEAELRIDCAQALDGRELKKMTLWSVGQKPLVINSKPDLFMFERTQQVKKFARIIAVVEVKGKAGHQVLHSDDEDDYSASSLEVIDEDSEEELPMVEKLVRLKRPHMKRLRRESRRYTRRFLPQLLGEMMCSFGEELSMPHIMENGTLLGVAVVGFDVYFVSLVTNKECSSTQTMFCNPENFIHVFITKPLDMCIKRDRRIIFKVLAAMCFLDTPLARPPSVRSQNTLVDLDLTPLKNGSPCIK